MTDFLQNLGTIGCLGAERQAFATQLSATHTTRKSHVFAGTPLSTPNNYQISAWRGDPRRTFPFQQGKSNRASILNFKGEFVRGSKSLSRTACRCCGLVSWTAQKFLNVALHCISSRSNSRDLENLLRFHASTFIMSVILDPDQDSGRFPILGMAQYDK